MDDKEISSANGREVVRLREELEQAREKNRESQRAWIEAVGLLSTLKPDMVVDTENPVEMAKQIFYEVQTLQSYLKQYETIVERIKKEDRELTQALGKALGYPWFKDDKDTFPEATEEDGVCVGDQTLYTLVQQAIDRLSMKPISTAPSNAYAIVYGGGAIHFARGYENGEWIDYHTKKKIYPTHWVYCPNFPEQ